MKISVLGSGSKGNCTYIESDSRRILIDIGLSSLSIEKRLKNLGIDPKSIHDIFITHSHVDHIAGLRVFTKKYAVNVYITKKMTLEMKDSLIHANVHFIEDTVDLDDISVSLFRTSHDVEDSVGYIVSSKGKSVVYITDTGYIHTKNIEKIMNKDIYILESNHDIEMLMNGKYPYHIKQRILGDSGHLSNHDAAYYASKVVGDQTKKIILAHLSEENNNPSLALTTFKKTFEDKEINFNEFMIAYQDTHTEMIEI